MPRRPVPSENPCSCLLPSTPHLRYRKCNEKVKRWTTRVTVATTATMTTTARAVHAGYQLPCPAFQQPVPWGWTGTFSTTRSYVHVAYILAIVTIGASRRGEQPVFFSSLFTTKTCKAVHNKGIRVGILLRFSGQEYDEERVV